MPLDVSLTTAPPPWRSADATPRSSIWMVIGSRVLSVRSQSRAVQVWLHSPRFRGENSAASETVEWPRTVPGDVNKI